ncbi:hypothetical protein Vadar_026214 [Vaccinium darrowii]|uniref:Uncharacterized protein n=2 Tax=Vaccinium darrowii TaxID=229202 RepID=A0ACB7ZE58_9ERIC|nr:hypothetical protein Vadar_010426 [Vaccinium darrowii]KAH7864140.1 hypothetical protein Vadar_026214 [Vaccinium darrowii]
MVHESTPPINPSNGFTKSNSSSTANVTPSLYLSMTPTTSPHSSCHEPTMARSPSSTPPPATTSPWASKKVIDNHGDCCSGDKGHN